MLLRVELRQSMFAFAIPCLMIQVLHLLTHLLLLAFIQ